MSIGQIALWLVCFLLIGREVSVAHMKIFQKVMQYSLSLFLLLLILSPQAHASQLRSLNLSLSDSTESLTAVHTFTFTHPTAATIQQIHFKYCAEPSGDSDACTTITNLITTGATKSSLSGLTSPEWSVDGATTARLPMLRHVGSGQAVSANTVITLAMGAIQNSAIDDCQAGGDASADTCYVRVRSYGEIPAVTIIDQGITSYTVVQAITVSARVDPSFTFTVSSVGANTVNNAITTSVASTYSTLPFGNLTAGTPKYAAQRLNVISNTQSGYTISQKLTTVMTGVYGSNNIDPFVATWGTPTTWTEPTGSSPSVDTGWLGANTTDADLTAFGAGLFGPVSDSTAYPVMSATSSDNGSTSVYVTYGIEANVFQAADTYTGVLIYNALPIY